MAGSDQSVNLGGMLTNIAETTGSMAESYAPVMKAATKPRGDMNDPAHLRNLAQWASNNGDAAAAQSYMAEARRLSEQATADAKRLRAEQGSAAMGNIRLGMEQVLAAGAEITIGSSKLVLMMGEDEPVSPVPDRAQAAQLEIAWLLDEELVELMGTTDVGRKADLIGQDLRLPPGLNAVVEVVAGSDAGRVFRFNRGNVSIGRRQGEVPLSDIEVSRHHAVIEVFGRDMIFLRDLGSTNGTYHNGRRISVSRLEQGDTIGVGKTVMKLQVSR